MNMLGQCGVFYSLSMEENKWGTSYIHRLQSQEKIIITTQHNPLHKQVV